MKMGDLSLGIIVVFLSLYITLLATIREPLKKAQVLSYSSSCPSACDTNSDGSFTISDAQTFASCIFSGCATDVNGDGTINAGDVSYCTANCQDILITPTPIPTTVPTPTTYIPPTTVPVVSTQTSTNNNTSTYIPPTAVPTQKQTQSSSGTNLTVGITKSSIKLRKDVIKNDYSKYCDANHDGNITTSDIDFINKCIFDGNGYCATTDINADIKVDAGDLSAAVLCSQNGQAMPNCKGADFNNDERITQDEISKISSCVFSQCSLIDPNNDGKTDAGDISKCVILSQSQPQKPAFSCSLCANINFCVDSSLTSLQDCIFNPNNPLCQQKNTLGKNVWDINKDEVVDAGDISAFSLCRSCNGVCSNAVTLPKTSIIQKKLNSMSIFMNSIWLSISSFFK